MRWFVNLTQMTLASNTAKQPILSKLQHQYFFCKMQIRVRWYLMNAIPKLDADMLMLLKEDR